MTTPPNPEIFHVHVDRLRSIVDDGYLWCDRVAIERSVSGTTIGIGQIKQRRLSRSLSSRPNLRVGSCVPFYFGPRSVMLFLIARRNHRQLAYKGGQGPIVHLVADLRRTVQSAENEGLRWAFTLSNAGAAYFEDRCRLKDLRDVDWEAVEARHWTTVKEHKQAEFLVENRFPWKLIDHVGVRTKTVQRQVESVLPEEGSRPSVKVQRNWYC